MFKINLSLIFYSFKLFCKNILKEELEAKMSSLQRTVKGLIAHCATLQKIHNWRGIGGDGGGWREQIILRKKKKWLRCKPEKVVRCEIT